MVSSEALPLVDSTSRGSVSYGSVLQEYPKSEVNHVAQNFQLQAKQTEQDQQQELPQLQQYQEQAQAQHYQEQPQLQQAKLQAKQQLLNAVEFVYANFDWSSQ